MGTAAANMPTSTLPLLVVAFAAVSYAVPIKQFVGTSDGRLPNKLLNVSAGRLIPGLGGIGGDQKCDRFFNPDCSALPRQMVYAVDYAMDPTGRHLYVATRGINYVGECDQEGKIAPPCKSVAIHDNTSRLIYYDLETRDEPVTLSYCGPWNAVEYDAHRQQVIALRNVNLKSDFHGTHYASEVVAFNVAKGPVPAKD